MTEELIDSIAKLNSSALKKIIVNSRFECTFIMPKLKDNKTYVFFSKAFKEPNSPRMQQYADIFVHDIEANEDYECSELYINNDYDIGKKILMLHLGKKVDGVKKILSMHIVVDAVVEDSKDIVIRKSSCNGEDCKDTCESNVDSCEQEDNSNSSIAKKTMEECKILYCMKDLPMSKTCICYGWECNKGWHHVLRKLSCELEALNLLVYDKWKVRIQADQVKEKFGTLRFYYSVVCDNYNKIGLEAKKLIDAFEQKKDNGYFGLKSVVDQKGYSSDEIGEDGKMISIWHPPKCHVEVTLHKDEYVQMNKVAKDAHKRLVENGYDDITPEQNIMMEWLDSEADKRVRQAEKDCYDICEDCGCQIGTNWSPRCETTGWIKYICHHCAEKYENIEYMKNGELWSGKSRLKTKTEVQAERKALDKKLRKFEETEPTDEEIEETQEKFNNDILEAMNEDKK